MALTSVVMKVLERLVLKELKTQTAALLDPAQFAYRANRSVDDAVALGLHYVLQHLEKPGTYARLLFIDYSSAFNTIIPQKLYNKLIDMGVDPPLCQWLLDFLSDRPQSVRVGSSESMSLTLNVGAPQGCVLSPCLFSLFTNDCVSNHESVKMIKFSDDTTLEGLIATKDSDKLPIQDPEHEYRNEVKNLEEWCRENNLELNVDKTKEVIVDFRKNKSEIPPLEIQGKLVEQVEHFRFLGTIVKNDLKWDENCTKAISKAKQRLYFLRQLRKFKASIPIMLQFYRAVIESVLTFSIGVWYGAATQDDKDKLESIVLSASKIIGCPLPSLDDIYSKRTRKRARMIARDSSHPANEIFELLPSGRRYRAMKTRTKRFGDSFFPSAISILNH